MTIMIDCSTPGVLTVRCGEEKVEIPLRLPADFESMRYEAPKEPAVEPAPAPPPVTESKPDTQGEMPEKDPTRRIVLPPPMPGVMGIVTITGRRPRQWIGAPVWRSVLGQALPLADLTLPHDLAGRIARWREAAGVREGAAMLLDLAIDPKAAQTRIDVASLQRLIDDPATGIDAVRLNVVPGPDPV